MHRTIPEAAEVLAIPVVANNALWAAPILGETRGEEGWMGRLVCALVRFLTGIGSEHLML